MARQTHVNYSQYQTLYQRSITEPAEFWAEQATTFIDWFKQWETVKVGDFENLDIRWFVGAKLNVCYNCVDRHLATRANQVAIIWEGDDPKESLSLTYAELHEKICRLANALKQKGVQKGDRVGIYLPMIPEIAIAMLACARIGAIHFVVFGGFSPDALKTRILDTGCRLIITADEGIRAGRFIPLKHNVDQALEDCPTVQQVLVVKRTGNSVSWNSQRDTWYHEIIADQELDCPCEIMDADDPLFILHTSGSTGKPKGVLHVTGGYLVYIAVTHYYVFDYGEGDVHWCTADAGWITGHSYVVYGPLANGATTLIFEGAPHYPNFSRCWNVIDKHQVNIFYTAPTAIRALRREGNQWVDDTKRTSLKLLGSVGEPINPDVWEWYYQIVGDERCPIVDTWWQTETGGILITPLPGATPLKPGSATRPFFGIVPAIVDEAGNPTPREVLGNLVITQPWPGMMRTIYGDPNRFVETYFKAFPGKYLTGDSAYQDEDGYYWIKGRNDDVIKVSGHRLGTEELESALLSHPAIAEAAVVAIPDEIKGESIYAFVVLKKNILPSEDLKIALIQHVAEVISPIAKPAYIQWTEALPKTRSGKIMRRILRKIACGELENLGDTSTLADSSVVDDLVRHMSQ